MIPELEVLEQVVGSDLPLNVIAGLFADLDHCRPVIRAMLNEGQMGVLDPEGRPVPYWRYRELEGDPTFWAPGTAYRLSITDVGADRIAGHQQRLGEETRRLIPASSALADLLRDGKLRH